MSLNRSSQFFQVLIEAYKVTVRRVTARQRHSQTLVPPRATAVSLQGWLGAHMEEPRGNMKKYVKNMKEYVNNM